MNSFLDLSSWYWDSFFYRSKSSADFLSYDIKSSTFLLDWSNFSLFSLNFSSLVSIFVYCYLLFNLSYSLSISSFWILSSRLLFDKDSSSFCFYTARRFSLILEILSDAALSSFSLSKSLRSSSIIYFVLTFISPWIISIVFCNFCISFAFIWFCCDSSCFYCANWPL